MEQGELDAVVAESQTARRDGEASRWGARSRSTAQCGGGEREELLRGRERGEIDEVVAESPTARRDGEASGWGARRRSTKRSYAYRARRSSPLGTP